ncbi:hypothetical protein ACF059_31690 [Streptomyces sp. NPDC016562]|uniref:hypothetical protein n=1 Tax=Streptomyces sp. NPDC016562 TaxID=3364966 RepID=UPI003700EDC5
MSMTPSWQTLLSDSRHTADVNQFLDEFFRRLPPTTRSTPAVTPARSPEWPAR